MRRTTILLGGASAVFALILAFEILPASGSVANSAPLPASVTRPAARSDTLPLDAWADIVLGRPVFAPERRPSPSARGPHMPLPRLAGTIGSGPDALAIFQPEGGKAVITRPGETMGDWTVAEIRSGAVTLTRGRDHVTMGLRYADQKVEAPPPARTGTVLLHDKRTDPFLQW